MDFGVPPIGRPDPPTQGFRAAAKRPAAPSPDFRVELSSAAASAAGPPPHLRDEMNAASRVYEELQDMGRELRFQPNPETGRVEIEVRDAEGNLIRAIPPSLLLDIASGSPLS